MLVSWQTRVLGVRSFTSHVAAREVRTSYLDVFAVRVPSYFIRINHIRIWSLTLARSRACSSSPNLLLRYRARESLHQNGWTCLRVVMSNMFFGGGALSRHTGSALVELHRPHPASFGDKLEPEFCEVG